MVNPRGDHRNPLVNKTPNQKRKRHFDAVTEIVHIKKTVIPSIEDLFP